MGPQQRRVRRQQQLTCARAIEPSSTEPLIDTDLFGIRSFSTGNLATAIIGLAEFGILAVLPLWLQFTLGYSALQTGLMITAVAVGSFLASGVSVALARTTSALGLVRLGLLLEIAGLVVLAALADVGSGWLVIAAALVLYGASGGFATAQVTNVVLVDIPSRRAGRRSGLQTASRQLGSALGIALVTTVFFGGLGTGLDETLRDDDLPAPRAAARP